MEPEHTPRTRTRATFARGPARPILERKQKPDGSWREYACTLVYRAPGLAVIRFLLPAGAAFPTPVPVPPGSYSDGYFWERRPFTLYRLRAADGAPLAHRFDAATAVRIGETAVEYRDLVLDWWVLPGDELIEEDRDELDALRAANALAPADLAAIAESERAVYSRYRHVIDEAARIERRVGVGRGGVGERG